MSSRKPLLLIGLLGIAWLAGGPKGALAPARERPASLGPLAPAEGEDKGDRLPHKDAYRRLGTVRFRNGDGVLSLAYSPNGKVLASGGRNDPVHLWNADTGQ